MKYPFSVLYVCTHGKFMDKFHLSTAPRSSIMFQPTVRVEWITSRETTILRRQHQLCIEIWRNAFTFVSFPVVKLKKGHLVFRRYDDADMCVIFSFRHLPLHKARKYNEWMNTHPIQIFIWSILSNIYTNIYWETDVIMRLFIALLLHKKTFHIFLLSYK